MCSEVRITTFAATWWTSLSEFYNCLSAYLYQDSFLILQSYRQEIKDIVDLIVRMNIDLEERQISTYGGTMRREGKPEKLVQVSTRTEKLRVC